MTHAPMTALNSRCNDRARNARRARATAAVEGLLCAANDGATAHELSE